MKFDVLTPYGSIYKDEADYAVIYNDDGQTAILKNHMPIVINIVTGYVKLINQDIQIFIYLENAIIEFKQNNLKILAMEAQMGLTLEKAYQTFLDEKHRKEQLTKKENIDYTQQEHELRENIAKSRAGML